MVIISPPLLPKYLENNDFINKSRILSAILIPSLWEKKLLPDKLYEIIVVVYTAHGLVLTSRFIDG